MKPEPLYRAENLRSAYQLRYGWTGWASRSPFPIDSIASVLPAIAPEWELDGLRVLESSIAPKQIKLLVSTTPKVDPITLAARIKGRIQHHCRRRGTSINFSRKVAVRSIGDPTRAEVEAYLRNQVVNEDLADERFRTLLENFTVIDPQVDLSAPAETNSGRYWYNLHLVLVVNQRYRVGEAATLARMRDTVLRICAKKGYQASVTSLLPDHLHLAIRGALDQAPEAIALSFLNNLAYVLDRQQWWQAGYSENMEWLQCVESWKLISRRNSHETASPAGRPAGVGAGFGQFF